jgi:hypothetical protein
LSNGNEPDIGLENDRFVDERATHLSAEKVFIPRFYPFSGVHLWVVTVYVKFDAKAML